MMTKDELVKVAAEHGFEPALNIKGDQKIHGCMKCRANTAFEFIRPSNGRRLAACTCGYRMVLATRKPKVKTDPEPWRCQALTKKGVRCKNKAQAGCCFCGPHNK